MATKKPDPIEAGAAFRLIELASDQAIELLNSSQERVELRLIRLEELFKLIKKTSKTARFSVEVANKEAMERMIQLGPGLTVRKFDKGELGDPIPPVSIT